MSERLSAIRRRGLLLTAVLVVLGLAWLIWPREVARVGASEGDPRPVVPADTPRFDARQQPEQVQMMAVAVVDRSGQPIADAQVCLVITARDAAAQRCASTDPQGIAEGFQPPTNERWRIGVSAPGYRPATIPRLGEPQPSGALIRVTMVEGGTRLRGRIEDATGGVIEGAFVTVEDETGASLAATLSQAGGEFGLWGPAGQVVIRAIADGYAASEEQLILPSGPVVLRLLPESAISGRVLDAESGQPIADAIVIARRSDDDNRSQADDARFTTRSNADGHYELVGMPAGAFQLTSQGPAGYGASEGAVVLAFAERREGVDIRVHRGTSLEIEVVRIEQGDGCPAARVRLLEEQTGLAIATLTDALGRAQLSLPVAGRYQVAVACVGHRPVEEDQTVSVSGRPDERVTLRVEVDRGSSAHGRVVNDDDSPIADAVVALISIHANTPAATAITDPEGRFELTGLEPGSYVALARAPGWFPLELPVEARLPSDEPITIPMQAGGALSGRVIDRDGAAVAEARVLVKRHANNARFRGETIVDGEGRFTFEQLPPGEYSVDVIGSTGQSLVDPGLERAVHATVSITAGERSEIELVVAASAGVITGRVVRSDGEPIAAAFVCAESTTRARGALAQPRCAATDVDGSFELRGLQAGRYTVTARVRGGGEARADDVEPGDEVELVVRGTGTLVGSAHYTDGGKAPDLLVVEAVRKDAEVRRREVFLRSDGHWSITGLPAGDYAIRIHASAGSGFAEAQVEADTETNVGDIEIDDRTSLSGRVVRLETGEPLPGFRVVATALDAQLRSRYVRGDARNVSDARGRFAITDSPVGRVTLHVIPENLAARPPDLTQAHVTVTINPGSPLDVGDIAIPTARVPAGQPRASFGFDLVRWDHVGDQAEQPARVETIEPGGPAARAGLELGDVITAIDGFDVIGRRYILKYRMIAPVGTTITLDTERAAGVVIRGE